MSKIESDYKILKIMEDEIPTKKLHLDSGEVVDDENSEESFDFSTSDIEELENSSDLKIVEGNEVNNDLNNNSSRVSKESNGSNFESFEEDSDEEYSADIVINEALNATSDKIAYKVERRDSLIDIGSLVNEDEAIVNFLDDNTDEVSKNHKWSIHYWEKVQVFGDARTLCFSFASVLSNCHLHTFCSLQKSRSKLISNQIFSLFFPGRG